MINKKQFAILFGMNLICSMVYAMDRKTPTLQGACISKISNNFKKYNNIFFSYLPRDLQVQILFKRLKTLYNKQYECHDFEAKTEHIIKQLMEVLASDVIVTQNQAESILNYLMDIVSIKNAPILLDALSNMHENQQLLSAAIRWGFENKTFEKFDFCFDSKKREIVDIKQLSDEYDEDDLIVTGKIEKTIDNLYHCKVYCNDELVKSLEVPKIWNGIIHSHEQAIAYNAKKNIIAIPSYVQVPGKNFVCDVRLDIILSDDLYYHYLNPSSFHFLGATNQNPVIKIVFNKESNKLFFITKDGNSLIVTLPSSIASLIGNKLSFQEVAFILIIVRLHENKSNCVEDNEYIVEKLIEHKILDSIAEKNSDLAGCLKSNINDILEQKISL